MVSGRTLAVFVKEPRPGAVKTRLAAVIGAEDAALVYRRLVEGLLEATTPAPGEFERLVFFDPPEAAERMRAWLPGGRLRRQGKGDLGARMAGAFERCFARGAGRVVLVGSDVAGLGAAEVGEAFAALDRHDVVLGPAHDGGYWLVGLRAPQPSLFDGVRWSTPFVLEETLARASAAGLSVAQLGVRRDLDTADDLRAEWPRVLALLGPLPDLRVRLAAALGEDAAGRA